MNHTQSCLSKEVLQRIGHDEILPDDLRAIEDHVSQCEHCRGLFAEATVEPAWAETILPVLRDRSHDLPGAGNGANSGEADQWIGNEAALRLLGPTDDPRMLGRIGPYEVTGIIGRGGMGVVFKAFDAALNRFVAIKMLLPHLASSGSARKRFSREGQAAAAVIDDHVLPIYGVDQWQGVPYIVTQYSSGTSLQKRLHEQGPLELKEILRISLQVARGLAAAHAQGLVHRDVKPSNILLDRTVERALLTDFGLARAVDDATITRSGTIAGTPEYMAPEQARGETVDQRSDLFSLGAVMYAMCTGHSPFRAETSFGVMHRIMQDLPRPITEINPDIPLWLANFVMKLLSKKTDDRFQCAEEVTELLEGCLSHTQAPTRRPLPAPVIELAANPTRHRWWLKFLAASVFLSMLFCAGVLIVLELDKGTLRIESEADDVPIRIVQGKEVVETMSVSKSGDSVRIAAGNYEVEIDGEIDGLRLDNGTVTLQRGGDDIIRIFRVLAEASSSNPAKGLPPVTGAAPTHAPVEPSIERASKANEAYVRGTGEVVVPQERQQSVSSPVEGFVRRIGESMVAGAHVKQGENLLEIEPNRANLGADRLQIKAPRDGTLMRLKVFERGQALKEGDELFTIFTDTSQRAVALWISGNDAPLVQRGDHVRLHFEGWPAVEPAGSFRGEVMAIDPVADAAGKFRILVKPDGNDSWPNVHYLRPGVRANGWIQVSAKANPVMQQAMQQLDNGAVASDSPVVQITSLAAIEAQLARLPARVHHDFVKEGRPGDRFTLRGENADQQVVATDDGLLVTHPGKTGYSSSCIDTQLRVHGNFEVTVSFENFAFARCDDGSGAISLMAILDNKAHTHCSVQRGARIDAANPTWHFVQSEFVHSPARQPGVVWPVTKKEDATCGRLRLARVGDKLHCLFAAGDSAEFRLIHMETVGPEDLLFGGVRLNVGVQSNGSEHGAASVVWKKLTIRAERITDWTGQVQARSSVGNE